MKDIVAIAVRNEEQAMTERVRLKTNGVDPELFTFVTAPYMFDKYQLGHAIRFGLRPEEKVVAVRDTRLSTLMSGQPRSRCAVDRVVGAFVGAAFGDALGWPHSEDRARRVGSEFERRIVVHELGQAVWRALSAARRAY